MAEPAGSGRGGAAAGGGALAGAAGGGPSATAAGACAGGFLCLSRKTAVSLAVAVFYAASSLFLGLLNKVLLSSYGFNGYFTLLAGQLAASLALVAAARRAPGNPLGIPDYDPAVHRAAVAMGVMYVVNVGAGFVGLQAVSVPMFACVRRLVSPVIIVYEFAALGKRQPPAINAAVATIVLGTLVAGWDSLEADLAGYAFVMVNNVCTAASSVMQKQFKDTAAGGAAAGGVGINAWGVLYYNALTAAPLAAVLAVVSGELTALMTTFPHASSPSFWAGFAVSAAMGPLITYSTTLSTTHNSPLATSVTGNIKDIATTVIGAVAFPGFVATATSVGGLIVSFAGAGAFSYASLQRMRAAEAAAGAATTGGGGGAAAADGGSAAAGPAAGSVSGAPPPSAASSSSADASVGGGGGAAPGGGGDDGDDDVPDQPLLPLASRSGGVRAGASGRSR
jgi:solute carrier family 35 protein